MSDEPDTKWNVQVKFLNEKPQDKTAEVPKKAERSPSKKLTKRQSTKGKSPRGPRTATGN